MNEYYQPYYDFDQEPIQQGWIPDQNINTNQIYESPYYLQYENQVNADIQNQFQDYMQQRAMQEQQLQKNTKVNIMRLKMEILLVRQQEHMEYLQKNLQN